MDEVLTGPVPHIAAVISEFPYWRCHEGSFIGADAGGGGWTRDRDDTRQDGTGQGTIQTTGERVLVCGQPIPKLFRV